MSPQPLNQEYATLNGSQETLSDFYQNISPQFEERVLQLADHHANKEELCHQQKENSGQIVQTLVPMETESGPENILYTTSKSHSIQVEVKSKEVESLKESYYTDKHFDKILIKLEEEIQKEISREKSTYPQYELDHQGLIYFCDWNDNLRLCIGRSKIEEIISNDHDTLIESAHAGYHRTYNRIASNYYWPRMAKDIREYVRSCDVCQKTKHRKHPPYGLLQPLPIPSEPFETITMDFITELPNSEGYDAILVIVDKLTKYGMFIPVHTVDTFSETARVIFQQVVAHYGVPREIVSDRDRVWSGEFWKEVCSYMDIKRLLSTAYHPQMDGQTENLNQTLEIALRAYINESMDNWSQLLSSFILSYNTTQHSSTGFSPAFLLRGYQPRTPNTHLPQAHSENSIPRVNNQEYLHSGISLIHPESVETAEHLSLRTLACVQCDECFIL